MGAKHVEEEEEEDVDDDDDRESTCYDFAAPFG